MHTPLCSIGEAAPFKKQLRFEQRGSEFVAVLTLTLPGGERKEYVAMLGPDEVQRFAASLDRSDSIEGRALMRRAREIGVDAPGAREWWWRATSARALGFSPDDKSPAALAAYDTWWNKNPKGKDWREDARATYLAFRAEKNPATGKALYLDPPAALAWWQSRGKERRRQIIHRYRRGPWDAGRVAKDVGKVALDVAPLVLTAVPGIGPVVGPALLVIKQLASAKVLDIAGKALKGSNVGKELGATAKLVGADVALRAGAPKTAAKLIKRAKLAAPAAALKAADVTRANIGRVAEKPDVIALARAGQLRSNAGGKVSESELRAAASSGRVFYIAA